MTDQEANSSRRTFIRHSLTGSVLLASAAANKSAVADDDPPQSDSSASTVDSEILNVNPTQPSEDQVASDELSNQYVTPKVSPTYKKLYQHILKIEAFNHHLHFGDEEKTLDWYHPHATVAKSETASRGMVPGILRLLDMSEDSVTQENSDKVVERYKAFVNGQTQTEYYHKMCDLTHTSHVLFIAFPYQKEALWRLPSERLKLAMYIDHFLFPLNNSLIKAQHPSYENRLTGLEMSMAAEQEALGAVPDDFSDYLTYIDHAIERHRRTRGVIGAKMSFSYYRSFDVRPVTFEEAKRIYEAKDNSLANYKKVQDYLAFHLLKICGKHDLPVQIHTGLGSDPGLVLQHSNAALLDGLLSRPELTSTRIVLIHGGYPYCNQVGVMARRKNVWLEFSWMPLLLHPGTLAGYLQEWLEFNGPNKILFGVDASGLAMITGTWCARRALTLALTRMVEEGQISEVEALGWAQAVLSRNAKHVYEQTL